VTQKRTIFVFTSLMLAVSTLALTGCDRLDTQIQKLKQRAVEEIAGQRALNPVVTWPSSSTGQYLAARVAIAHDDLETASQSFAGAIQTAENAESVSYLVERALPVAIGNGNQELALSLSHNIIDVKATASGQLAVLINLREAFKAKNWDRVQTLLQDLRGDGFGQYVQPLVQVWLLAGQGQTTESLAALDKSSRANPSFRSLFALHRALILDMTDQPMQAEKAYQQLLEQHFSLRNALMAADYFHRQGNKKAVDTIAKQIQDKTALPFDVKDLASGLNKKNATRNAEQGFANILFDLATVLQQENSSRLALLYARIAEPSLPEQMMFPVLMGDIYMDMRDYPKARSFYKSVSRHSIFHAVSQLRLADSYAVQGDMIEALNILSPLKAHPVLQRQVITQMADLLRTAKQYDEAVSYYTQIIDTLEKPKKSDWALFYARGICYESIGQWKKAEADLTQSLKLNPNQPEVLNYLGYSWADQGNNLEKAYDYIVKAHQYAPQDPYIIDSVGWILYRMGYFKDAVPYLEESVQYLPADAVINDHLGDAYWQVGRKQEARFQWERALKNSDGQKLEFIESMKKKIEQGIKRLPMQEKPLPDMENMAEADTMPDFMPPEFHQLKPVKKP
jgi:tetratricopeptide (TPR) repeat protein